jgi:hypothetical protein
MVVQGFGWIVEKITGVKDTMTGFFGAWGDDLDRLAKEQFAAASAAFERIGKGGEGMQGIIDAANKRAGLKAETAKAFTAAGVITPDALKPKASEKGHEFGGAFEMGSKEAYSSIVRAMFGKSDQGEQKKIAGNTERTAGATERSAALLEKMAGGVSSGGVKPLTPANPAAF